MSLAGERRALPIALCAGLGAVTGALWLAHLDHAGLACLGPAAFALALLALGRYPGERLLLALARSRSRRRLRPRAVAQPRERNRARTPRGGLLLGAALAGRAPPAARGVPEQAIARARGRAPASRRRLRRAVRTTNLQEATR